MHATEILNVTGVKEAFRIPVNVIDRQVKLPVCPDSLDIAGFINIIMTSFPYG